MQLSQPFLRDLANVVQVFDYGAREDGQPVYRGVASLGTAEASSGWIIFYHEYDASGFVTSIQSTEGIWSLREDYFS